MAPGSDLSPIEDLVKRGIDDLHLRCARTLQCNFFVSSGYLSLVLSFFSPKNDFCLIHRTPKEIPQQKYKNYESWYVNILVKHMYCYILNFELNCIVNFLPGEVISILSTLKTI